MAELETRGMLEERIAEVRARLEGVTPGPWFVWDGVGYFLGGKDLCIGAGPTWLANMDHRACDKRTEHGVLAELLRGNVTPKCSPEENTHLLSIAETFEECGHADAFTAEQIANANFIARAREDVPFLLSVVSGLETLRDELQAEIDRLRYPESRAPHPETPGHQP